MAVAGGFRSLINSGDDIKFFALHKALLLLLITTSLIPAAPLQLREIDGRIWNRMRTDNKLYYLTGLLQGLEKVNEIMGVEIRNQAEQEFAFTKPFFVDRIQTRISFYLPDGTQLSLRQVTELLDLFYEDEYNQRIEILNALKIVLARQKGETQKAELWLKQARRRAYGK